MPWHHNYPTLANDVFLQRQDRGNLRLFIPARRRTKEV